MAYHQYFAVVKQWAYRLRFAYHDKRAGVICTQGVPVNHSRWFSLLARLCRSWIIRRWFYLPTVTTWMVSSLAHSLNAISLFVRLPSRRRIGRSEKLYRSHPVVCLYDHSKVYAGGKGRQHPLLSDRRNIVVIADEAHRSQYDFLMALLTHARRSAERLFYRIYRYAD